MSLVGCSSPEQLIGLKGILRPPQGTQASGWLFQFDLVERAGGLPKVSYGHLSFAQATEVISVSRGTLGLLGDSAVILTGLPTAECRPSAIAALRGDAVIAVR